MILSRYLPGMDPPKIQLQEKKFESPITGDFVCVQGGFTNFIQKMEEKLEIKVEKSAKISKIQNDGTLIF
jgi:hypothetical protein